MFFVLFDHFMVFMINEFLVTKIQDISVTDLWFQQDSATCHTAGETIGLLNENVHKYLKKWTGELASKIL